MAKSIHLAPAKLSPVKRRCFQMFKKAYYEKWPFITFDKKGDTCMSSSSQNSCEMIGLAVSPA